MIQEVPGLTYGLFEAGPFGQKPIQISVRGPRDRRARPHLARADAGDGDDQGRGRHRDQPREGQARAARAARPRARQRPRGARRRHRHDPARRRRGRGGHGDRGQRGRQPRRARAPARRPAPLRRRTCSPSRCPPTRTTTTRTSCWCRCASWPRPSPAPARRPSAARTWCARCGSPRTPTAARSARSRADIEAAVARLSLPPGYDVLLGGDAEELKDMFANMMQALLLAVVFIYLILASPVRLVPAAVRDHAVACRCRSSASRSPSGRPATT